MRLPSSIVLALASVVAIPAMAASSDATATITVRTETFARPPYSGATYYVYERDGRTVCTKLAVCNKYDQCSTRYVPGAFRDEDDTGAGEPASTSPAVVIPPTALSKHVCLTRFGLAARR
jgi:predicted lipoprotein with Yx(FWY)xxD motif